MTESNYLDHSISTTAERTLEGLINHTPIPLFRTDKSNAEAQTTKLPTDRIPPWIEIKQRGFSFADLFAGIGGFRLALEELGGVCQFSSENDEFAVQTYRENFGSNPLGDIREENVQQAIPYSVDVLCAGFPCQSFSIAGERKGFADLRGSLVFELIEVIKSSQPKAFILENVKGLKTHHKGETLRRILELLREGCGYSVPDPQIMDAQDFGLAQKRQRLFIVGFRKDLRATDFSFPQSVSQKSTFADVREEGVVPIKFFISKRYLKSLFRHKREQGKKGNNFGFELIAEGDLANTVMCGGMGLERNLTLDMVSFSYHEVNSPELSATQTPVRKMTPREWARLQGFPEDFRIPVSDTQAYKQFGNTVAVPVVRTLAEKVLEALN